MKHLQCQSCNSVINWNGTDKFIICPSCGTRYQMTPQEKKEKADPLKSGCFADRPILSGADAGKILYSAWLPEGWQYTVGSEKNFFRHGASILTPFVPFIVMYTPDKTSHITHYTSNGYMDPGNMPLTSGTPAGDVFIVGKIGFGNNESSNDPSSLGVPSYIRWRSLVSASDYCDELAILDNYCSNISVVQEQTEMDDVVKGRIEQVKKSLPNEVAQTLWWDWCRKLYRGQHDGVEYSVICEAQISTSGFNVEEAAMRREMEQRREQRAGTGLAGMFGMFADGFAQAMGPQSSLPRWWQTDYEAVFVCPLELFDKLYPEYIKFIETIELGRDFKTEQDIVANFINQEAAKAQGMLNDTMAQMAADRAASMQRRSNIIRETNEYTSGVMHDMMASNSASMDRVRNMQSEAIGGYNVYQGTDGNLVRADIGFDHVYQGTGQHSDTLIGVEGGWLEPGVDFVPLDKIDGGNY